MRNNMDILLLNTSDYTNINEIRRLLRAWRTLELLSYRGNTVALSILMDLKTALGEYGSDKTTLTPIEIEFIRDSIIYGCSQQELAITAGITQKTVSVKIKAGLMKISKLLCNKIA